MKSLRVAKAVVLVLLVLVGIFLALVNIAPVSGQEISPTQTPVPTKTNAAESSIVVVVTLEVNLHEQNLQDNQQLYEQVLTTADNAVEEVHSTLDNFLVLIGVVIAVMSASGFGVAYQLSSYARRASDKAATANQNSALAIDTIKQIETKAKEIEQRTFLANQMTEGLNQRQAVLTKEIEKSQDALSALRSELNHMRNDHKELKRPLTLMLVDDYGMQLFSKKNSERDKAITMLVELTNRKDSVVQRKSVKTLGTLETYSERVVKRLKDIIKSDAAQGVRREAEKSLSLIESRKNNGNSGRKS